MKYLTLLLLLLGASVFTMAQNIHSEHEFPMTLDSFYLKVVFADGSKSDYEVHKTPEGWRSYETVVYTVPDLKNDSLGDKGLMFDSVVSGVADFSDIQTVLMFGMHVKGTIAKDVILTPMLPCDNLEMLVNRELYLKDSLQGRPSYLDILEISLNRQWHLRDSLQGNPSHSY
jgi:hypothetical protein